MRISRTATYPAAPGEVFAVVADVDFQDAKCVDSGALEHEVSVEEDGERTIVTARRAMPTDGLPDVARSFVGSEVTVVETQDWGPGERDGSRHGRVHLTVSGAPMTMIGTLSLEPHPSGTIETIEADLKASVPLIGGKLEKAAAPVIVAAIEAEVSLIHDHLGG